MTIKPLNANKQIVVSNTINEARFKMTKAEQKLFLYCVGHVDNNESKLGQEFHMTVKDFADFLEIERTNALRQMTKITRDFIGKVVEFYEHGKTQYKQMPVLTSVSYNLNKGDVTFKVNPDLKPYLIDLKKQFTQYSLQEVIQFKSIYSMRIYQILNQWDFVGQITYTIEKLRFMLSIEDEEYKLYGDFKRKVLEVAFKEINKNSVLKYTYKELKTGRKVTSILFTINQAKKPKKDQIQENLPMVQILEEKTEETKSNINFVMIDYPQDNQQINELVQRLIALGYTKQNSQKILEECGEDYILFALQKSKVEERSKIDNKAGYFTSVIGTYKETYKDQKQREEEEKEQSRISQELQEQREKELEERKKKFEEEQEELSRTILEEEPELFCKKVYDYMDTFISINWGFHNHPDWRKNREEGKKEENIKIAKEIRSRFLACTSLRDFRNLIKYDESWLFKSVFNEMGEFDKNSDDYYKAKHKVARLDKIQLPFKI
jgi:plasmid replication initiation protein